MQQAFKEWDAVCHFLGAGEQSILLRKGGIAEGRAGFSFKHESFFLYPTAFHEAGEALKWPVAPGPSRDLEKEGVQLSYFARAEWSVLLDDWAQVEALAPLHCWTENVVRERFTWNEKSGRDCLSLALVRVFQLREPFGFPYQKRYGGCRSWIEVPEPEGEWQANWRPVVSDEVHQERDQRARALVGRSPT